METNKLSDWAHDEIIYSLVKLLNEHYVFPDIAIKMESYLKLMMDKEDYKSISNPEVFSKKITQDLQKVSNDKHLKLIYQKQARLNNEGHSEKEQIKEKVVQAKINNYGFYKVERLLGNIGYIDLREFCDPKIAGETAVNAMNLVTNTEALIFDLRKNGGGSPSMVAFIISHLYDSGAFHLNSFYSRKNDFLSQSWTLSYVPGKRFANKPVYVLTSRETFSGAEEFAYHLKNLKRATIIGEITKGGANPGAIHQLTENFSVFIPDGRSVSPITQTNWEGKGVTPDIKTTKQKALETAYIHALYHVISQYHDKEPFEYLVNEAENKLKQLEGNK